MLIFSKYVKYHRILSFQSIIKDVTLPDCGVFYGRPIVDEINLRLTMTICIAYIRYAYKKHVGR